MNRYGLLCRCIYENPNITQREMASRLEVSLGTVNNLIKECVSANLISFNNEAGIYELCTGGSELLEEFRVDAAVILAAGFGSRFVPLTFEMPKGLLEVFGERMIERQIKQLNAAGISDITIVVGYLKEKFEYLIDKYNVKLLYNREYSSKNTIATLYHARELFRNRNVYLLSSDNWMRDNMFHAFECGAWYSSVFTDKETSEWCLHFNKKGLISEVEVGGKDSWFMYGPAFFSKEFSNKFIPVLESYYVFPGTEQFYWEQVYLEMLNGDAARRFKENGVSSPDMRIEMYVNRQPDGQVYEFENLEELRLFDSKYQNNSENEAMELISEVFKVPESEIQNIRCLKAGMTNKSFLFKVNDIDYICRIPGSGTELLINRREEKAVYDTVGNLGITEHIIYFNDSNGYKIAEFYDGSRNADASNHDDMMTCMEILRKLHHSSLKVEHSFCLSERIDFYEKLCREHGDILFEDYSVVRTHMNELFSAVDALNLPQTLCHIDSNVDNFLFIPDGRVKLIDWEYSGMCNPILDVSMSAIYPYYNEAEADWLLEAYLERKPSDTEIFVYYAYMALGAFLWALWAVYKAQLGTEFGEYTIIMYRYAKTYYKKVLKLFPDMLRKL